ncbi:MAG: Verru_Chthon cassette protein A [Chthoniobacteraceae bacterium]
MKQRNRRDIPRRSAAPTINGVMRLWSGREKGMALILVLSFLVLISMLIIAFFSSVMTESTVSKSYADGVSTKQLADSAASLVMGTLKEATSPSSGSTGPATTAWASQPGMIRTYATDGTPAVYYKLYSSDAIKISDNLSSYDPGNDLPSSWDQQAALYTDLNAPVLKPSASDPSVTVPVFPIVDPRAYSTGTGSVEGFSYTKDPSASGTTTVLPGADPNTQRLPMPVRWLYVLQDGSVTVPSSYSNGAAVWAGTETNAPSSTNPIVGRIAYWTDDESCKVNINTAAGDLANLSSLPTDGSQGVGSFWDIPRVDLPMERHLADNQPCQYEYQRYPGHPGTVFLSTIFPGLSRADICAIAPRVVDGGSKGGSQVTFSGTLASLTPDNDRRYTSVDELMFAAPSGAGTATRQQNPVITPDSLQKANFFLTANGRSPDLNLFGQPRVSVWPLSSGTDSNHRTATDRLIAFCTTVGGLPYYFTRSDPNSSTNDFSLNTQNQRLYDYLQTATGRAVPGFTSSASFLTKYPNPGGTATASDRDQILTEIFDYIRITNLHDAGLPASTGAPFTPTSGSTSASQGSGQVVPIKITSSRGTTQGFGRFDTISQASLQFIATGTTVSSGTAQVSAMRAVILFTPYNVAGGYAGYYPNYQYVIPNLATITSSAPSLTSGSNFRVVMTTGSGVSATTSTTALVFQNNTNSLTQWTGVWDFRPWGGAEGIANQLIYTSVKTPTPKRTNISGTGFSSVSFDPVQMYPFITTEIPVSGTTFTLLNTTVTLQIVANNSVVQSMDLNFPQATLPVPSIPTQTALMNYDTRLSTINTTNFGNLITSSDTIRSLQLSGAAYGDVRLMQTYPGGHVPASYFDTDINYSTTTAKSAHNLFSGLPYRALAGANTGAKLVFNASYYAIPALPAAKLVASLSAGDKTSVPMSNGQPGDWDTGISNGADGPYINKTDDGTNAASSGGDPYFSYIEGFASSLSSPNRQTASAVQFGSLPTGVMAQHPWQTLLFRPDPSGHHPGSAAPKDYLLLDLFTMPVVEPYAISEPLSTAGRINMNYRIAPFDYIRRSTALHATLKSIMVMAIPANDASTCKTPGNTTGGPYRFYVDPDSQTGTLKFFEDRFNYSDSNDSQHRGLFVSSAEICDIPLVPQGLSVAANMSTFWNNYTLTGDNLREMPYAHLYPLLTTRSNTYTVHLKVQALKKAASTDPNRNKQWVEGKDQVLGEYSGSVIIERYIDPQDTRLSSGNSSYVNPDSNSLEPLYRYHVIGTKKFAP